MDKRSVEMNKQRFCRKIYVYFYLYYVFCNETIIDYIINVMLHRNDNHKQLDHQNLEFSSLLGLDQHLNFDDNKIIESR